MKLGLDDLRAITRGVVDVTEENGVFSFFRFTKAQAEAYAAAGHRDFYEKTFASADVRFAFATDAEVMAFDYRFARGSSREFGYFDVYENGTMTAHFGLEKTDDQAHHAEIRFSRGEKQVELYFPWSRKTTLQNVELPDGASIRSLHRKSSMICFGDSITHGYDAVYPSLSYTNILGRALDADGVNKAIGGDVFFPELLASPDAAAPDFITVAYGTNDWSHCSPQSTEERATAFFHRLSLLYPASRIFAIMPIWRDSDPAKSQFGMPVSGMRPLFERAVAGLGNVTLIEGYNLVPHLTEFFSDHYLHPNDAGFAIYGANLAKKIVGSR